MDQGNEFSLGILTWEVFIMLKFVFMKSTGLCSVQGKFRRVLETGLFKHDFK